MKMRDLHRRCVQCHHGGGAGAAGRAVPGLAATAPDGPAPAVPKPTVPSPLYQGRRSFAQQGEDLILYNLLCHDLQLQAPSYLDIGAGDPVLSNNTYVLYLTGSRGVLVEPNPVLVRKLKAVRPGDVVVACGVGLEAATAADYFVIRGRWPLNTFSREAIAGYRRESRPTRSSVCSRCRSSQSTVCWTTTSKGPRTSCRSTSKAWTSQCSGRWTSARTDRRPSAPRPRNPACPTTRLPSRGSCGQKATWPARTPSTTRFRRPEPAPGASRLKPRPPPSPARRA